MIKICEITHNDKKMCSPKCCCVLQSAAVCCRVRWSWIVSYCILQSTISWFIEGHFVFGSSKVLPIENNVSISVMLFSTWYATVCHCEVSCISMQHIRLAWCATACHGKVPSTPAVLKNDIMCWWASLCCRLTWCAAKRRSATQSYITCFQPR